MTVALAAKGEAKLGAGSTSPGALIASCPIPDSAKAFQIRSWLAPPNRTRSAASMLSRMSVMLTSPDACNRNESNISWTHRRLPGHASTPTAPSAQLSCNPGVPAP